MKSKGIQEYVSMILCNPTVFPRDFPGKNTGVRCHSLLQGIFLTQGSNLGLLHCRQFLYQLSYVLRPSTEAKGRFSGSKEQNTRGPHSLIQDHTWHEPELNYRGRRKNLSHFKVAVFGYFRFLIIKHDPFPHELGWSQSCLWYTAFGDLKVL